MKYFKVKIGYKDDDFISIDETELKKALIAQVTGKIAIFKGGSIAGNSIISVLPNYNEEMGWNRDYKLTGEDYRQIGRESIDESRLLIEQTTNEINGVENNPKLHESAKKLGNIFRLG